MCAACGVLGGGPDWLDRPAGEDQRGTPSGAERQRRIALVNLLLAGPRLRLRAFGPYMVLDSPTGRTEIVEDLRHVWLQADRMNAAHVDPLDPEFLEALGGESSGG